MIELTRLNGTSLVLNSDLIKTCEASPDTMITLLNGEKLIVREDLAQIRQRVLSYRAQLLATVVGQIQNMRPTTPELYAATELCEQTDHAARSTSSVLRWER